MASKSEQSEHDGVPPAPESTEIGGAHPNTNGSAPNTKKEVISRNQPTSTSPRLPSVAEQQDCEQPSSAEQKDRDLGTQEPPCIPGGWKTEVALAAVIVLVLVVNLSVALTRDSPSKSAAIAPPAPNTPAPDDPAPDVGNLDGSTRAKCFENGVELQEAVDEYWNDIVFRINNSSTRDTAVTQTYGYPIGLWCVDKVEEFGGLFSTQRNSAISQNAFSRNDPDVSISSWNVSKARDLSSMFQGQADFNADISGWDVSNVVDMHSMFEGASSFNQDLLSWDVSNVVDMSHMFSGALKFNGSLSTWDVSNVEKMDFLFNATNTFNQNITDWDVSKVRSMTGMFNVATGFNQNISSWDISNVIAFDRMFQDAESFNGNLCSWGPRILQGEGGGGDEVNAANNTRNVTLHGMFYFTGCTYENDPNLTATPPGPFCSLCYTRHSTFP